MPRQLGELPPDPLDDPPSATTRGICDGCERVDFVQQAVPILGYGKYCNRCIRSALAQEQNDGYDERYR